MDAQRLVEQLIPTALFTHQLCTVVAKSFRHSKARGATSTIMKNYLEHINMSVTNMDAALNFFQTAFPSFYKRGGGSHDGHAWVHFGDEDFYVAINDRAEGQPNAEKDYDAVGVNHAGFVVDDAAALSRRMETAGYKHSYPKQADKYRIREYFFDADGNEFEFVQYLSEKPEERNSYEETTAS